MEYAVSRGLKISKIMLGTVQLGLDYGINNNQGKPTLEKAHGILEEAIDGGINAFDTSSAYGTSESVLGSYFGNDKKNSTIITKFSVMNHDNPLSKLEAEKKIIEQVENSLSSLGYRSLPLLLMHNEYDLDVYGQTVIDTLKRLKSNGLVERVGISLNHFDYVDKVLQNDMFEAVQLPLNMLDVKNATGNAIKRLKDRNLLVFIRSVFLQGLFFRDPETLPNGVLQKAKEPLKMVRKIAEEENMSIAGLAISYIRDLDGVSSLVMGADNREQVKENINLINVKKISDSAREKITKAFVGVDERVLCPWLWNK